MAGPLRNCLLRPWIASTQVFICKYSRVFSSLALASFDSRGCSLFHRTDRTGPDTHPKTRTGRTEYLTRTGRLTNYLRSGSRLGRIMLKKIPIILFSNSYTFTHYSHKFHTLFSQFYQLFSQWFHQTFCKGYIIYESHWLLH